MLRYTSIILVLGVFLITACNQAPIEEISQSPSENRSAPGATQHSSTAVNQPAEQPAHDSADRLAHTIHAFNGVTSYSSHYSIRTQQEETLGDCVFTGDDTIWCSSVAIARGSSIGLQTDIFSFVNHYWMKSPETSDEWRFVRFEDMHAGYQGPTSLDLIETVTAVTADTLSDPPSYRVDLNYDVPHLLESLVVTDLDSSPFSGSGADVLAKGVLWVDEATHLPKQELIILSDGSDAESPLLEMSITYRNYGEDIELPYIPPGEEMLLLINTFMTAMREGNYEVAHESFSSRAQAEVTVAALRSFAGREPILFAEYEVLNLALTEQEEVNGVEGTFQILVIEVVNEEQEEPVFRFVLEQEGEEWRIFRFDYLTT